MLASSSMMAGFNGTTTIHFTVSIEPLYRFEDTNIPDAAVSIKSLNLDFVKSTGYANLRCVWAIGCPSELEPARYLRERPEDPDHPTAVEFPDGFLDLFPGAQVPDVVAIPCCSQFAVSRKRIRDRPIDDYIRYRDWLVNTSLPTDVSGRIFEYSWHSMLVSAG